MKLDLPVMVAALLLAALLQELIPAIPCGLPSFKLQLLPAVAIYYLYRRQWPVALTAALWAGIATDALGGLPRGTTSLTLLGAGLVIIALRDVQEKRSPWRALLPGMAVAAIAGLVQVFAFRGADGVLSRPPFLRAMAFILKTLPLAALAAVAVDAVLSKVELMAGNVEPREPGVPR